MKKSLLFPLLIVIVICVYTLTRQRRLLHELRDEATQLQSQVAIPNRGLNHPSRKSSHSKSIELSELLAHFENDDSQHQVYSSLAVLESIQSWNQKKSSRLLDELLNRLHSKDVNEQEIATTRLLLAVFAQQDPEHTLRLLDQIPPNLSKKFFGLRNSILEELTMHNPELALSTLKTTDQKRDQTSSVHLVTIARTFLRNDPTKALPILLARDDFQSFIIDRAISSAGGNPELAQDVITELNSHSMGEREFHMLSGLLAGTIELQSTESADQILSSIHEISPQNRDKLFHRISSYSTTEPEWVIKFALEQSSPESRSTHIKDTIIQWADNDFRSTANWLDQQTPSPDRDTMIAAFATRIKAIDPNSAKAWLQQIQDPTIRAKTERSFGSEKTD